MEYGLSPVIDRECKILILGSFPSARSRGVFFYNHPRNRFWQVMSEILGSPAPVTPEDKRAWLLSHRIALTDIVTYCDIVGSLDSDIRISSRDQITDVPSLIRGTKIGTVFCNGTRSYSLTARYYPELTPILLPSTSPANTGFDRSSWDQVGVALHNAGVR